MKIHRELIGTIPMVEHLRDSLGKLIQRHETMKPEVQPEFGLMSKTDIKLYLEEAFKDGQTRQYIADSVTIELCAQHFYGLTSTDFSTFPEFVAVIKSIIEIENATSIAFREEVYKFLDSQ